MNRLTKLYAYGGGIHQLPLAICYIARLDLFLSYTPCGS